MVRKLVKPAQSNAAIQKLLDVHSDRKRAQPSWSEVEQEDYDWTKSAAALDEEPHSVEEIPPHETDYDTSWAPESRSLSQLEYIQDLSQRSVEYTVLFRGTLKNLSERHRAQVDLILSLKLYSEESGEFERPKKAWQINEHEVLASFGLLGYQQVLRSRIVRLGYAQYHVIPCRLTPQALFQRLDDMDAADDIDVGQDDTRDPLVAASLIPGLRRSEYTHAINPRMYHGFCSHRHHLNMLKQTCKIEQKPTPQPSE